MESIEWNGNGFVGPITSSIQLKVALYVLYTVYKQFITLIELRICIMIDH